MDLVKNKGITLVALVITIIILLILAGISIASLTGSGLFENAKLAEEKTKNAQEKEDKILDEYEKLIEGGYRNNNYNSKIYDLWTTWLYLAGVENPENYNEQNVLENITVLNKLMNSENAVEYMFKSKYFIMPAITNSQIAMTELGNAKETIKRKIIETDEFIKTIADSTYRSDFSEYVSYNAGTVIGTAGGRYYYKKNDGFALAGAYKLSGARFILVSKNSDNVIGYCSYNTSVITEPTSFEYDGETWYYAQIPYGFTDGTGVSSATNCKNIGAVTSNEEAAKYMLDDFFGKTE